MEIQEVPITSVIPYAGNPRKNEAAVDKVAQSITEFGFRQPIVVDEQMVVIAGHTRLLAAKALGLKTVPIHVAAGLSPAKVRAYRLADNRTNEDAGWDVEKLRSELAALRDEDFDLALTGFDDNELAGFLADAIGATDPDEVPAVPVVPVSRRGDLWLLGNHRFLCGDSTNADDVKRLMNGERAALFATDPPYLVDYDGTGHPVNRKASARRKKLANKDWSESYIEEKHWDDSSQGPQFYEAFMRAAVDHAITDNAAWYCWHASRRQRMLEDCWDKFDVLFHQQVVWVKTGGVLTRSVLLWQHEPCLFGWRRSQKPRVNREGFDMWPTTVWHIPHRGEDKGVEHPTIKPVKVFTLPMALHTLPGELCYEPFSGSGTQFIAGETTGRRVFGLEKSEAFCDVVVSRWQAFAGRNAILDGDGRTFEQIKEERQTSKAAA